jgi:dephospho-CoA kinase
LNMKSVVIGITGPIASGKSVVAKIFGRRGAAVIDADEIGHRIIAPQTKAWHGIVKAFGSKVLNRGGTVNRKKLGSIVFSDVAALEKLNRITHSEMRRVIAERIRAAKLMKKKLIVVNAAVLEKMRLLPLVDRVIAVLADKKIRVRRLQRSGMPGAEALARIGAQKKDSAYRRIADIVIENNGTTKYLNEKIKRIISAL